MCSQVRLPETDSLKKSLNKSQDIEVLYYLIQRQTDPPPLGIELRVINAGQILLRQISLRKRHYTKNITETVIRKNYLIHPRDELR